MVYAFSPIVRFLHWLNAVCILGLMSSGWTIYNADPFYGFEFPSMMTLGGYLTGALRWHFLFMWGLMIGSMLQVTIRVFIRSGGPALFPVRLSQVANEFKYTLQLKLSHKSGVYIHIQRLLYLIVFLIFVIIILSGLAIWKPVQLQLITEAFGGYEIARRWHFWSMSAIGGFVLVHLVMVIIVPSTLLAMLFGAKPQKENN